MRDEEDTVDYPASWVESGEAICARERACQVGPRAFAADTSEADARMEVRPPLSILRWFTHEAAWQTDREVRARISRAFEPRPGCEAFFYDATCPFRSAPPLASRKTPILRYFS